MHKEYKKEEKNKIKSINEKNRKKEKPKKLLVDIPYWLSPEGSQQNKIIKTYKKLIPAPEAILKLIYLYYDQYTC